MVVNGFRSKIFPLQPTEGTGMSTSHPSDVTHATKVFDLSHLKILTSKQMLQRLLIAAQVTAGDTSKNLLNEIRQIIYSLYQAKKITKKVYNNIMNSIKV